MIESLSPLTVLVLGIGDVGSAVAHRLFGMGYNVVLHDRPDPAYLRRRMAFTDAAFDGKTCLANVWAKRCPDALSLGAMSRCRRAIPFAYHDLEQCIGEIRPRVLVDARMRKRDRQPRYGGLVEFSIGIGPGFQTGDNTDVVIESCWGESLGDVITHGKAKDLEGEPRPLGGVGRERFVYASRAGVFRSCFGIGEAVAKGELIARIGGKDMTATMDGVLRGLTRSGVNVAIGTKVIEIDPRGYAAEYEGLGERPRRIAEGVDAALSMSGRLP